MTGPIFVLTTAGAMALPVYTSIFGKLFKRKAQSLKPNDSRFGDTAYAGKFPEPAGYYNSMGYVRAGDIIVLPADEDYYKTFPDNPNTIFVRHFHDAYYYLAKKLPDNYGSPAPRILAVYISFSVKRISHFQREVKCIG